MDANPSVGFLGLALLLGLKHAFDADHLVAVSGLLTRSQSLKRTSLLSISWALGHMLTAGILTVVLFTFRETVLRQVLANFDILVPVMLLLIAALTLAFEFKLLHFHRHKHSSGGHAGREREHAHLHVHTRTSDRSAHGAMIGIGVIHGIASNDELLLLFTLSLGVQSLEGILLGVIVFTFGVILGMIAYGVAVNYPAQKWGRSLVARWINVTIASLSVFYALWLLAGIDGINILEILGVSF